MLIWQFNLIFVEESNISTKFTVCFLNNLHKCYLNKKRMCVDSERKGVEEDLAGIGEREILIRIYYVKYIKISTSIIERKKHKQL